MRWSLAVLFGCLYAGLPCAGGNLCQNGTFDHAEDPLKYWHTDYRWTGNKHYLDNYRRVSVIPQDGLKYKVMRIEGTEHETKVESRAIPLTAGKILVAAVPA